MERSSKRGKIPQQDWPSIIKRYEAGETLASIARTYDCSPPAISYIVSRSRARDATAESATPDTTAPSEPRLVKGQANGSPAAERVPTEAEQIEPRQIPDEARDSPEQQKDPAAREGTGPAEQYSKRQLDTNPTGNGYPLRSSEHGGMPPQNSEPRRTLHLSLSHDGANPSEVHQQDASRTSGSASGERFAARPGESQQGFVQPGRQADDQSASANGAPVRMVSDPPRKKEGGAFIDQALRERVDGDISAFLAAFDTALAHDTPESRAGLREATDRLLRAGARTRIELERLEARVPLPPRENSGPAAPVWRPR